MTHLNCFKAYDIRGKLGDDLNEEIAYRIGRAFAQHLNASKIVVGSDIRLSSNSLKQALAKGITDSGSDVIDIGMSGTEEIYFATFHLDVDGGIEVTASHNPIDYNGMKLVREGSQPISCDTGLKDIQRLTEGNVFKQIQNKGIVTELNILDDYISHILSYVCLENINPLKIVVNAGNGAAGHVIDAIETRFEELATPIEFVKIHHEPDGSFPNGIPNPLLPENRSSTSDAVLQHHADIGIAWDGDFDRCFFFDEKGSFIEGYYIVGLLAENFLQKFPGQKIIHDPRLTWNTIDIVEKSGGEAIQSKTGHAFIKERMRAENAIYGGEMSAHHYFRDFAYCDSGMIPWLLVVELLSLTGKSLSSLVEERMTSYPCSGEINYEIKDAPSAIDRVKDHLLSKYGKLGFRVTTDMTDGLSMEFPDWRLNLRCSNTEPLLRLNVESNKDPQFVELRVSEIKSLIFQQTC